MAVIMCHVRCVYEPVAVEVGEERFGLACVRVTVEHSSCKMAPRSPLSPVSLPLGRGDRLGAASSVSYGALNSAIWYARVCTTQSRSRQLKLDSPIGPKLWT